MKEIFLLKEGEIALKGLNRSSFEDALIKNIKRSLKDLGEFSYRRSQSTIVVEPTGNCDLQQAEERLGATFGISAFSKAAVAPKDFGEICALARTYLQPDLQSAKTFKVEAKRSDKRFCMTSPQICEKLGEQLLEAFPHLNVDVHKPDRIVRVEIRDKNAYLYSNRKKGAGGIPVGCGGEGMLLISGGIDSPVAGWMMAKRGLRLHGVHFVSPPYTSDRALQKVKTLVSIVARFSGAVPFHCVPFTSLQEAIKQHCPEEFFTIIMRRMMMRIAQMLCAEQNQVAHGHLQALITGESLGQVASQTLGAMVCTDAVCEMPVLRPQIGMDKEEIVSIARKINTFETSILPYEDCCTVFTPRHPKTRPRLKDIEKAESRFCFRPMIEQAVKDTEFSMIHPDWML